jgi:hypothetical protein
MPEVLPHFLSDKFTGRVNLKAGTGANFILPREVAL